MKRKRKSTFKTILFMIIFSAAIVAVYFAMSANKDTNKVESASVENEVDKLLSKNIDMAYPPTPREVIKLYSRILKCLYSEDMTEKQVRDMSEQVRCLFDNELLAKNPETEHLDAIEADIAGYKVNDKSIVSYTIEKASNVIEDVVDGIPYATLRAYYTVKQENKYTRSYEEFIVRQDTEGKWKILGWRESDSSEMEFD